MLKSTIVEDARGLGPKFKLNVVGHCMTHNNYQLNVFHVVGLNGLHSAKLVESTSKEKAQRGIIPSREISQSIFLIS